MNLVAIYLRTILVLICKLKQFVILIFFFTVGFEDIICHVIDIVSFKSFL